MPTPSTAKWPKPRSEDEFEDIVVDFVRIRWKDPNAQRHGRRGQRQHGVDILGYPHWLAGGAAAAQCKNTDNLTLADVVAEVAKAVTFPGGLREFYVVTTGDRDAALQSQVRNHFRATPAPFDVEVIFWPDLVADLSGDPTLVAKHWPGFQSHPAQSLTFPAPKRINRDKVKNNETTECQCEFAVRLLNPNQLDATELRAELKQACNRPPSDYLGGSMLEKPPSQEAGRLIWTDSSRSYDNVIEKWELEIGDGGHMVRRWSKFSTLPMVQFDSYDLFSHVVLPLVKYAEAIRSWSASMGEGNQARRVSLRLDLHATKPPELEDRVKLIEATFRYAKQVSPTAWQIELDADLALGAPRIAMRLLNRALGRFEEHALVPGQQAQLVRIDEAAYIACLAKSGIK